MIKPRIFNSSFHFFFLNIFFIIFSQTIEKLNILSKIDDILEFLKFLYLLHLMQHIFLSFHFRIYQEKTNLVLNY